MPRPFHAPSVPAKAAGILALAVTLLALIGLPGARAQEGPGRDPLPPEPAPATILIGKVIPGFPEDSTGFVATVSSCSSTGGPELPALFVSFSQPEPGRADVAPGCWELVESTSLLSYSLIGWAFAGWDADGNVLCPGEPERTDQPFRIELAEGETRAVCFYNSRRRNDPVDPKDPIDPNPIDPKDPIGGGTIAIAKVVEGDPADDTIFTAAVHGGPAVPVVQFSQPTPGVVTGLPAGSYKVVEAPHPGYEVLGYAFGALTKPGACPDRRTDCMNWDWPVAGSPGIAIVCPDRPGFKGDTADVTLRPGDEGPKSPEEVQQKPETTSDFVIICFYNAPLSAAEDPVDEGPPAVAVRVEKTEHVIGLERPGAGWQFTLTGCGIEPRTAVTGPGGVALFDALPPAVGCAYTVTETPRPGWSAVTLGQDARPREPGEVVTLRFVNIYEWNPPCLLAGCVELPPADPAPPPPATPAPPAAPQVTPPAAPATPAPQSPGTPPASSATGGPPGDSASLATPIPPAAGTGRPKTGGSALPPLAACALLTLAVSAGLTTVAVSRRR